jgi:hypothetical protein
VGQSSRQSPARVERPTNNLEQSRVVLARYKG